MTYSYDAISECGPVRSINQDAVYSRAQGDTGLFVVADGMGGHANGEKASQAVTDGVSRWFARKFCPDEGMEERTESLDESPYRQQTESFQTLVSSLVDALQAENLSVFRTYNNGNEVCGATVALLFCMKDRYAIVSVGDSRIYRVRRFQMEQLTTDDVWEKDDACVKGLTQAQIDTHPNRGKLVRAFGSREQALFHVQTAKLEAGSLFLLCSDGVYKYCDGGALRKTARHAMRGGNSVKESTARIGRLCLDSNSRDNYSVVIVKCS